MEMVRLMIYAVISKPQKYYAVKCNRTLKCTLIINTSQLCQMYVWFLLFILYAILNIHLYRISILFGFLLLKAPWLASVWKWIVDEKCIYIHVSVRSGVVCADFAQPQLYFSWYSSLNVYELPAIGHNYGGWLQSHQSNK